MTLETFFEKFDQFAEAPNAVAKMRELVLELAVRGKLVVPNVTDEPASQLLKRVLAEKSRRTGRVEHLNEEQRTPGDEAFEIPANWQWIGATTPAVMVSDQGKKVQTKNMRDAGKYPVVDQGKVFIRGYSDDSERVINVVEPIVLFGDHTRETKLIDFDFVVGADGVKLLQPICIDPRFYFLVLRWLPLESRGYARHFKQLKAARIPLPPLAEQKRIVAKVDELMALCDRLEAQQQERETRHAALARASLSRFADAPTPANLQFLFHPSYTIAPADLRKSILTPAVQGKLVPQDPNDEPAEDVLAKIEVVKKRLSASGDLKADKRAWVNSSISPPHDIPDSWCWVRLQDVFEISRGGSPRPAGDPRFFGGTIPWITVGEVTKDSCRYLTKTATGLTDEGSTRSRFINPGDLLLTNSGATLGVPKISKIRGCMNDGVAVLRLFHPYSLNDFAYLYLTHQTPVFRNVNQGMGQPNLNTPIIAGWFFPLPPLAEQSRIVAKVDQLMALVDQLETQLAASRANAAKLLEALVAELTSRA